MDESFLLEKLRDLRKRYRKVLMLHRMMRCLFTASLISVALSVVFKIFGFGGPLIYYSLVPFALALAVPPVLFLFQKISLMTVALLADERLLLKERLSTLLEWIEEKKKRNTHVQGTP